MFKSLIGGLAIALISGAASAATFSGSFYKVTGDSGNFELNDAIAGVTPGNLVGTFTSTVIDYPNGSSGSTSTGTAVQTFLGVDGGSYSGSNVNLADSVFVFDGFLDLTNVSNIYVGSDDGFRLTLDGNVVGSTGRRGFNYSNIDVSGLSGIVEMELLYFEDSGYTGVALEVLRGGNRELAQAASPVPLPAAAPMLAAGVAGLVALRRARRKA